MDPELWVVRGAIIDDGHSDLVEQGVPDQVEDAGAAVDDLNSWEFQAGHRQGI